MIIKRIDVLSAAKIGGIIAAAIGLLAGIFMFLFSSLFGSMLGNEGGMFAAIGGFMGMILLPVIYGIFGFIGGAIQAFIYNVAAGFVGGIRIGTE
ncbi:hypothetical protein [Luteimonas granuli]|uniref:DUF3566 domain-containing protein n=1 Tax=Luteimonas granuli TaxID=1176533 RepID=A0A518N1H2_9GAMM|nr:hypothetical protein [Luteimonas granuli]QDW65763.1 hypothetical protein FPZ22_01670 [Luteimonas granuli]